MKEEIRRAFLASGAAAAGFAAAGVTDPAETARHARWIASGRHAGMEWLQRHLELKKHTDNVLPGAATVVSLAFSHVQEKGWRRGKGLIASYAAGLDYHDVLRSRLQEVCAGLREKFGGEWRVCIDSAPLPERYWALKGGLGVRGLNGSVIAEGCGSRCFLAEVLTTHPIEPDRPSEGTCLQCGACVKACPTGALPGDGTVDSNRCLNYLTIEHRGPWLGEQKKIMDSAAGRETLFGCDRCQDVCPLNRGMPATATGEFRAKETTATIGAEEIAGMTEMEFARAFKGTAIKRAKAAGMRRNALNVLGLGRECEGD